MQLDFVWTLVVSLALTLVLETVFCLVAGLRGVRNLIILVLVNILTNPPVVLLSSILLKTTNLPRFLIITVLELTAILVEAMCYRRCGENIRHPFVLSFGANTFSYFTALIINHLI
ncbi:MAG: hypothetical protein EOM51_08890 [Clostridia bacterium]|nr:hypothetical protein [Clostridia bacterium]